MVEALRFYASCLNISDKTGHVTPFARTVFGDENNIGLDPYLEKKDTLWLLHYFLCSDPCGFTALYFVFNRMARQSFSKKEVLEELQNFINNEIAVSHIKRPIPISANPLSKDIGVVLRTNAPLTHDVGVLRKEVRRLDNAEELSDTILRELQLIKRDINGAEFNCSDHLSLSSYVCNCLLYI